MTRLTLLIIFFKLYANGQSFTSFDIKLISKYDKKELAFSPLQVHQGGKLLKSVQADFEGNCKFNLINKGVIIITADGINYKPKDTLILLNNKINKFTIYLDSINEDIDYSKIYNEEVAYKDLRKGDVKILYVGLILDPEFNKINKCCKNFGFKYTFTTDIITGTVRESVKNYNKIVLQYLDLKNGKDWRSKFRTTCNLTLE